MLTLSDTEFRHNVEPAQVEAVEAPAGNELALHKKYRKSSDDLVAYGKTVYLAQCQACHGASGKGDDPAAGALKPVPRDFTSGIWTAGGTPAQVFVTLTKGVPGTGMSAFGSLSVKDRWAMVHFIRSIAPNPPAETKASLAATGLMKAEAGASSKPKLPIDMAIDIMVEEAKAR